MKHVTYRFEKMYKKNVKSTDVLQVLKWNSRETRSFQKLKYSHLPLAYSPPGQGTCEVKLEIRELTGKHRPNSEEIWLGLIIISARSWEKQESFWEQCSFVIAHHGHIDRDTAVDINFLQYARVPSITKGQFLKQFF